MKRSESLPESLLCLSALLVLLGACSPAQPEQPARNGRLVASNSAPLPRGLVCGLSYVQADDHLVINVPNTSPIWINFNNDNGGLGIDPHLDPSLQSYLPTIGSETSHNVWGGTCNNVSTLKNCYRHSATNWGAGPSAWFCQADQSPQDGYQLHVANDAGDSFSSWNNGSPGGQTTAGPWGFAYQAYLGTAAIPALTGSAGSDGFVLPKGTACGLSHTNNGAVANFGYQNDDPGCMGYNPLAPDPAPRCPPGWASRYMFDMSSGNGKKDCSLGLSTQPDCGFWAWCEYQDPHNLCDGKCLETVVRSGVALNLQSDTDSSGAAWCSRRDSPGAPGCTCYGGAQTPYFDQGRAAGQGLSWCGEFWTGGDTPGAPGLGYADIAYSCSTLNTACNVFSAPPQGGNLVCEKPCFGYFGCFADNPSRVLPNYVGSGYTVDSCQQAGYNFGYQYAGVEYGGQCFLGNSLDGLAQIGQAPNCAMPCSANTNEICGGSWALSVYYSRHIPPAPVSLSAAGSAALRVPSAIQLQWSFQGGLSGGYAPTSFNVYRSTATSASSKIASTTSTSFVDNNLADGNYFYAVTGVNASGESPMSSGAGAGAEHCDQATCSGCCSGNSCLPGNSPSTGCAQNGNVCAAACPSGYTCSAGACNAPPPPPPPPNCPPGQFDCCGDGFFCRSTSSACSKICCNC